MFLPLLPGFGSDSRCRGGSLSGGDGSRGLSGPASLCRPETGFSARQDFASFLCPPSPFPATASPPQNQEGGSQENFPISALTWSERVQLLLPPSVRAARATLPAPFPFCRGDWGGGEVNAPSGGGHRPFPAGLGDPDPLPFAQIPEIRVFEALKNALPSPLPLKRRVSLMGGGGCFARKRRGGGGGGGGGLGKRRVAASREEERQHMDAIVSIRFRCFAFLAFCLLKSPPEKGFFFFI